MASLRARRARHCHDRDYCTLVESYAVRAIQDVMDGGKFKVGRCFGIPTLGQKLLLAPQWSRWSVRALLSDLTHAVGAVIHHL
jgi:hypothetical protein